ncbi:unnamed protein product [Phytomonas sp. EM1]|nr:unnamed protein product [Phytomonas sp. EM1]|eukprot:CCW65006.1 unnamed protein product [Phytomonas sp. isolate EM1]
MFHFIKEVYSHVFYDSEYHILIIGDESSGKTTFLEQVKYIYRTDPPYPNHAPSFFSKIFRSGGEVVAPPNPAPRAYFAAKSIRPTVGVNLARIQHRFSPSTPPSHGVPMEPSPSTLPSDSSSNMTEVSSSSRLSSSAVITRGEPKSAARTRLAFWDLGGRPSLRVLWENYYPSCQAVIFLFDGAASGGKDDARYLAIHETLRGLLAHPALRGVPLLLLSNKADLPTRLPLPVLQEAIGLVELALQDVLYDVKAGKLTGGGNAREAVVGDSTEGIGRSGFGQRMVKLMEVSALDGSGVAAAMDWLVAQLTT